MTRGHKYHIERLATLLLEATKIHGIKFNVSESLLKSKLGSKTDKRRLMQTSLYFTTAPLPNTLKRTIGLPIRPSTSTSGKLGVRAASRDFLLKHGKVLHPARLIFTIIKQHGFVTPFSTHVALASWEEKNDKCFKKSIIKVNSYEYYPFLGLLFPKDCESAEEEVHSKLEDFILAYFSSQPLPHYMNARYALYSILSGASLEATEDNKYLIISSTNIAYVCLKSKERQSEIPIVDLMVGKDLRLYQGDVLLPIIDVKGTRKYTKLFTNVRLLITAEDAMLLRFAGGCSPALLMSITQIPLVNNKIIKTFYVIVEVPKVELLQDDTPAMGPYGLILTHLAGCLTSKAVKALAYSFDKLEKITEILGRPWQINTRKQLENTVRQLINYSNLNVESCITSVNKAIATQWFKLLKKLGYDPSTQITFKAIEVITRYYANLICEEDCRHPLLKWTIETLDDLLKEHSIISSLTYSLAKIGPVLLAALKITRRASLLLATLKEIGKP